MHVIQHVDHLRALLAEHRVRGGTVGFVPTMGALHAGHLSLVDAARARADLVVMSVFVNPLQFGPNEDFAAYPRDLAADRALAASRGVDVVFAPDTETLYPKTGAAPVRVIPELDPPRWEAAVRPGHFAGVLTVVAKLFNIVRPDVAVFGQKDIQQATLIRAMTAALDFPIDLVIAPIVREVDGLAMSSRNVYLSADERMHARALSRALRAAEERWRAGERSADALESAGKAVLDAETGVRTDYFAVVEPERLEPVGRAAPGSIIMVTARVGRTRLLDNIILGA
ncbi:MAG TPA: pantoate--beta-alanine ligase [Gemmatimonadaceae bacterium]|nr:pantoate--beta-alanine ligase [Gemmatimonadaceae bacterium]